jgi:signal transduction histidine kinase
VCTRPYARRVNQTRRRWIGLAIVVASAVVVATIQQRANLSVWPSFSLLSTGVFLSISWLSWTQFRNDRDPALVFIAVGSGAVAVEVIFGHEVARAIEAAELIDHPSIAERLATLAFYSTLIAPLVLSVCLALAPPWRDRRGHPPIRAGVVVLAAGLTLLGIDTAILIIEPDGADLFEALAWAIIVVSTVAILRSYPKAGWYRWVVGSAAALILAFGAWVLPSSWEWFNAAADSWIRVMPLVAALLLLAGVLATQGADASRMRRATDRAEQILGGRSEIANVISHDVRSPVSSIKSIAASTIANYDRLDDAQRLEFVGMIEREAQVALGIVHQMSVALRIDAGTLELVRRPTTIATVVRQAIGESETDGRRIEVEAAPGITANVDAKWLAEAIRQGLDNAAAFSPWESPIRVGVEDTGEGAAAITIHDEGPGIPPERRQEVFERFSRWRPPGYSDVPGSGLGLFICRGIVREHGGEATFENGVERGTILRILLPWSAD